MTGKPIRIRYDCSKCPGYCCSYPRIEVKDADVKRLAKHFELTLEQAQRKFTRLYKADGVSERILRHQKDEVYGSMCRFFDTTERRKGSKRCSKGGKLMSVDSWIASGEDRLHPFLTLS